MNNFSDDSPKEENKFRDEYDEFGTVFSAPPEHKDKKIKSPAKRKSAAVIAAVLAVCILVGGTLAVIKFIPKKDDDAVSTDNTITVLDFDKSKFDTVTVKNKNGEFIFLPETSDKSDDSSETEETVWYISGFENDKISTAKTESVISAAAKITAIMEITKKTYEECGFEDPVAQVSVASAELGDFSIVFGGISPDNSGIYLYSSIDEKIYLADIDAADSFNFDALYFANTDSVPAVKVSTTDEKYVDENGTLTSFDKLEILGSNFARPVVIVPIEDDGDLMSFLSYKVTSPVSRFADSENVAKFFGAFNSGISVYAVYSYDTDDSAIKQFGLDKPDCVLKLTVAGQMFTYKFALQQDGYYALFGDGMNTIKKISTSSAEYLGFGETDLYNKLVYIRSIYEIKNMTFTFGNEQYSFSISENDEEAEEKFTVLCGEKQLTSEYFQDFYAQFISLSIFDFLAEKVNAAADMTVKIEDNNGKTENISFFKNSATEYSCLLDGTWVGKITSSSYNKLISNLKTVSQNKSISS